jgi:hypothetical protein
MAGGVGRLQAGLLNRSDSLEGLAKDCFILRNRVG